jgi:hypothetical protein
MPYSSGMLHRVALVRTDVSEENITSVISVARIGELGTTLTVTSTRGQVSLHVVNVTWTDFDSLASILHLFNFGLRQGWFAVSVTQ